MGAWQLELIQYTPTSSSSTIMPTSDVSYVKFLRHTSISVATRSISASLSPINFDYNFIHAMLHVKQLNSTVTAYRVSSSGIRVQEHYRTHLLSVVELDYNVMVHARQTIFVCGWNGCVHILGQQVWGLDTSGCGQLVSALECLIKGLLSPMPCFPFTSCPSCRFVPSHSNRVLTQKPSLFSLS
jgi:hypothetical protein